MIELLQSAVPIPVPVAAGLLGVALLAAGWLVAQTARRQRAERQAERLRAELDTITASVREAIIAYDVDLRLIFVNPAFEHQTGYSSDDLRDGEFLQHIHPDDRAAILADWDHVAGGGVLRDQEYRVRTRTGQVRWTSAAWHPIRDRSGRLIGHLGTEFDITERKLAETERLQDTELFQAVLDVQKAVAAAGLDSRMVMHVIAERSRQITGAAGAVIETNGDGARVPSLRLGDTAAPKSELAVELQDDQRTLGILKLVSPQPNAFSPRDAKAIRLLGSLVGTALGHASAYESRQHRLEERTAALHDSEQRFKQLVDAAQEGIWIADERGAITYANGRMAEMLGQQSGALLGRNVADFVDPASRPGALRLLTEGARGQTERRDFRFCRQDGSALWAVVCASPVVDREGKMVGTVGLATDITERKQAEDRLRRSAERLTTLHDMDQAILAARSPADVGRAALARVRRMVPCQYCAVVLFDGAAGTGRLLAGYAGGTPLAADSLPPELLQAMTGARDTMQHVADLNALDAPPPLLAQLREEGLRSVLILPLLADGAPIGAVTLGSPTPGAFDAEHREVALEIAAPLAIAIQHARLREEMVRQTADLERRIADRNTALRVTGAELEIVLHAITHDLQPPLRHLGGFAQLLIEESAVAGNATLQHYSERVRDAGRRMATLVEDLLRLSRAARHDIMRRPVDLGALVEEIAGQLAAVNAGRSVSWEIDALPTVDADPVLARTAITELLSNAVKFTALRDHAVICVRPVQRDGQLGIAVQDNGVGFRMAHVGKLFGVFQRLHHTEEFDGNGAGLALAQRIAQRHGGQIWAEAEEDIGATFYLTFGARTVLA